MVKVQKNNIIKEVQENVVDDYLRLGWVIVKDKKESKSFASTNEDKTNNDRL